MNSDIVKILEVHGFTNQVLKGREFFVARSRKEDDMCENLREFLRANKWRVKRSPMSESFKKGGHEFFFNLNNPMGLISWTYTSR